jgi:hypothetical protein
MVKELFTLDPPANLTFTFYPLQTGHSFNQVRAPSSAGGGVGFQTVSLLLNGEVLTTQCRN